MCTYIFEFFIVLKGPGVIHFSQFVQLHQSELGLTQLPKLRLCVISSNILICTRGTFVKLIEDHGIFMPQVPPGWPAVALLEWILLYRQVRQVLLIDLLA